jgi:hypothetical protein
MSRTPNRPHFILLSVQDSNPLSWLLVCLRAAAFTVPKGVKINGEIEWLQIIALHCPRFGRRVLARTPSVAELGRSRARRRRVRGRSIQPPSLRLTSPPSFARNVTYSAPGQGEPCKKGDSASKFIGLFALLYGSGKLCERGSGSSGLTIPFIHIILETWKRHQLLERCPHWPTKADWESFVSWFSKVPMVCPLAKLPLAGDSQTLTRRSI